MRHKKIRAKNCWNFMDCPENVKKSCEVFKNKMGRECWRLFYIKKGCPASKKSCDCFSCYWYKKFNFKR